MEAGTFLVVSYGISADVLLAAIAIAWLIGPDHDSQRMLDEAERAPSSDEPGSGSAACYEPARSSDARASPNNVSATSSSMGHNSSSDRYS